MPFLSRYSFRAFLAISRSSGSSSAIRIWTGPSGLLMALFSFGLPQGQGDDERGALPRGAAGRDGAAVPLDDLAADGQPNPGALVLPAAVQALERGEDPVQVLFLEADAVVLDGDLAQRARRRLQGVAGAVGQHPGLDLHHGRLMGPVKFKRVA